MIRAILPALLALSFSAPAMAQSLEQMAGQMIVVGFKGDDAGDASVRALRDEIGAGTLGGVMYLKPNVKSLGAVKAMNAAFRAASPDLPPFLTLDQEGGAVERLTSAVGFEELPNAETIAGKDSPAEAEATYATMAKAIAEEGFTVNFGPVADLNVNPDNQIIAKYGRSFGKSAKTVAAYDQAFIEAHHDAGLLTALKHCPGHGSSTADSHEGFVDISKTWSPSELDPYKTLFANGYDDFVMVGHLYDKHHDVPGDKLQLPASLSSVWIGKVLREQLGYQGVVISDDLDMGAIRNMFKGAGDAGILRQTVIKAVNAGTDLLVFSNVQSQDIELGPKIHAIIAEAVRDGRIARSRIDKAYAKVTALKRKLMAHDLAGQG